MRRKLAFLFALFLLLAGGCANKEAGPQPPREAETKAARPDHTMEPEEPKLSYPEPETIPPMEEPPPERLLRAAGGEEDASPAIEEELLRLINEERERGGLAPFAMEDTMRFAARIRAEEALVSLSHTRPDETPYHTAFSEAGYSSAGKWHGENLAVLTVTEADYEPSEVAAALFREYADSLGHHSNILSEHFTETGVGIRHSEDGGVIRFGAAQMFAGA